MWIKLYWFEIHDKLAISVNWAKRDFFKKWDKVLVTKVDYLPLLRLGCKLINETEVEYNDVFKKGSSKKVETVEETDKPVVETTVETEVETVEETKA